MQMNAIDACNEIGGTKWVVKAQVHAGGRGKAGVQLIDSPNQAEAFAKNGLAKNSLLIRQTKMDN